MVAVSQAIAGKRQRTRRALTQKVKELEERLAAAQGESRKNMRARLARLAGENDELNKQVRELTSERDGLLRKLVEKQKEEGDAKQPVQQ